MRRISITVNAMASLYADLITAVINPGFAKVVEVAYKKGGEADGVVIVRYKRHNMNGYLIGSERQCASQEQAADVRLKRRLGEVHNAYTTKMAKKKKFKKAKKVTVGGER